MIFGLYCYALLFVLRYPIKTAKDMTRQLIIIACSINKRIVGGLGLTFRIQIDILLSASQYSDNPASTENRYKIPLKSQTHRYQLIYTTVYPSCLTMHGTLSDLPNNLHCQQLLILSGDIGCTLQFQ